MKTNYASWTRAIIFVSCIIMLPACDSNEAKGPGQAEFQITGAPTDDQAIKGLFVTITDIKVDGTSIPGFTKQTIDLKAYQEGNTKLLGAVKLDAKAVKNVTFVLDADTDADGRSPGSYVLTTDDQKLKLKSAGTVDVEVTKVWNVNSGGKTMMILDFDIRKLIQKVVDPAIRYKFMSDDNLKEAVRLVNRDKTGTIIGTYSDPRFDDAKIIVYAYKKGTFNAVSEIQPQGEGGILFKNSEASAEVKPGPYSMIYTLAFLEEGDYDLQFAMYSQDGLSHQLAFQSLLKSQTSMDETVFRFITVTAGATTSPNTMILSSSKDHDSKGH